MRLCLLSAPIMHLSSLKMQGCMYHSHLNNSTRAYPGACLLWLAALCTAGCFERDIACGQRFRSDLSAAQIASGSELTSMLQIAEQVVRILKD